MIQITPNLIAVEVPKGATGIEKQGVHSAFFAFYDTTPISTAKRFVIEPETNFECVCLSSEVQGSNLFSKEEIVALLDKIFDYNSHKLYALIRITN